MATGHLFALVHCQSPSGDGSYQTPFENITLNKRNTTDRQQILAEISKTRDVFTELDDFFRKADENISNDPDDPREGIGRLPGLDRLMFLIPCVISRLEEDISEDK